MTGFFSVLGMAIERFHMFAVVRDYSAIKRKFSIIWFLSSWTLSIVFVIILLPQIRDQVTCDWSTCPQSCHLLLDQNPAVLHQFRSKQAATKLVYVAASNIFPGKFLHLHRSSSIFKSMTFRTSQSRSCQHHDIRARGRGGGYLQ